MAIDKEMILFLGKYNLTYSLYDFSIIYPYRHSTAKNQPEDCHNAGFMVNNSKKS
jgi:hypothetical protein